VFDGMGFRILELLVTSLTVALGSLCALIALGNIVLDEDADPQSKIPGALYTFTLSVLVQLTSPFVLKQIPLDIAQRRIMGTPMVVVIWSFFLVTSFLLSAFTLLLVRKDSGPATKPIRWGSILLMAFWTLVFASILTGD
jgi:hypothetical protein